VPNNGRYASNNYRIIATHRMTLSADCVVKLFAALRASNNRIRLSGILNQCCALVFVLESLLLVLVVKIVLQHNLPIADIRLASFLSFEIRNGGFG
jgi:hypothetical protein